MAQCVVYTCFALATKIETRELGGHSMSKRKCSRILCPATAILFAASAFGGVNVVQFNGGALPGDYWPSSPTGNAPTSQVGSDPLIVSGNAGALGSPDSDLVSQLIAPGGTDAETFLSGSVGFKLGEVDFVMDGDATSNSIHLFQLNPAINGTSDAYDLSTDEVGHDLLGGGAGLSFSLSKSADPVIDEFVFSGNDNIALLPNTEYAIEVWNTGASGTDTIWRPVGHPYLDGAGYQATGPGAQSDNSAVVRNGLSANPRNLLFAVYPSVPEPGSAALVLIAAVGMLQRRRARGGNPPRTEFTPHVR
jgi:hypothetical protein